MTIIRKALRSVVSLTGASLAFGMWVAVPISAATFSFTTGTPDGKLWGAVAPCEPRENRNRDGR